VNQQRRRQKQPRQSHTRTERQTGRPGATTTGGATKTGAPEQRVKQPRQLQTRRQATGSASDVSNCVNALAIGMPLAGAADAPWVAASDTPAIINSAIKKLLINLSPVNRTQIRQSSSLGYDCEEIAANTFIPCSLTNCAVGVAHG
jgi:hypothetical protein